MYYTELIDRFWSFNQNVTIGTTAIAMYLYLLKVSRDQERYDFYISDVFLSNTLRMTRKTVITVKTKLQMLGLIEFQTKNGKPCHYRLLLNYNLQEYKNENSSVIAESQNAVDKDLPYSKNVLEEKRDMEAEISNDNIKIVADDGSENQNIPSYMEFLTYVQSLTDYNDTLDVFILEKYEIWVSNGWRNAFNRPITNWRNSIKNSLPYFKDMTNIQDHSLESIPSIERIKANQVKN